MNLSPKDAVAKAAQAIKGLRGGDKPPKIRQVIIVDHDPSTWSYGVQTLHSNARIEAYGIPSVGAVPVGDYAYAFEVDDALLVFGPVTDIPGWYATTAEIPTSGAYYGQEIFDAQRGYKLVWNGSAWALAYGASSDAGSGLWNNVTLGNGTAAREWTYNGGVDGGVLVIAGSFTAGTTTTLNASAATLATPTGFTPDASQDAVLPMGHSYIQNAAGGSGMGYCRRGTAAVSPLIQGAAGTYVGTGSFITSTVPGAWASGDKLLLQGTLRGTFIP